MKGSEFRVQGSGKVSIMSRLSIMSTLSTQTPWPPAPAPGQAPLNFRSFFSFGAIFLRFRAVSRCACHRTPENHRPGGSVSECGGKRYPARRRFSPQRVPRAAFTLIEMMLVIALASILMAMLASSLIQARNHARKAKAEAELREMVTAFIQYYNTYGEWPSTVAGENDLVITETVLKPLTDPNDEENPLGLVFLNKTFPKTEQEDDNVYFDPWKEPYRMSFDVSDLSADIAHTVSVWFPNKNRRW